MSRLAISVIGRGGQVARALVRAAAGSGSQLVARGRPELDLSNLDSTARFLAETRPDIVVNAAAYTAVDKAETEPGLAFRANAEGPARLATLCGHFKIPLIHLSTDYVFDGTARVPNREDDAIAPLGIYGASKAAGETAIRAAHPQHIILRTSWVYSPDGSNFVKTMLRLGGEREVVRVVGDQTGCPTSADHIATAILDIARQVAKDRTNAPWGTYHLTGRGETTWHDFAAEIFRLTANKGWPRPRLERITTAEYPTPARRPAYSVLDNTKVERAFGIRLPDWRSSLAICLDALDVPVQQRAPA